MVVAEGARPRGGELTIKRIIEKSTDRLRLGGVAYKLANEIEKIQRNIPKSEK